MSQKIDNPHLLEWEKNYSIGALSIFFTIIFLIAINLLILSFYNVDIKTLTSSYEMLLNPEFKSDVSVRPEPQERLQYLVTIFIMPVTLFACYVGFKKNIAELSKILKVIYPYVAIISVAIFIIVVYFGIKQDPIDFLLYTEKAAPYVELRQLIFPPLSNVSPTIFLSLPMLIFLLLLDYKSRIGKMLSGVFYLQLLILLLTIFAVNLFGEDDYPGDAIHFNAVYYSVAQVFNGSSILVDFNSQYGLYAHFIEPIFQIIGLSVVKYSVVMSLLVCSSFLGILIFLRNTIQNSFIVWLGFIAVIIYNYFLFQLFSGHDLYFQYWPIRLLFPCILLVVATVYFNSRSKSLYLFSFLLFSLGILWNLDSGIVVFLAWLALLCFDELFLNNRKLMVQRMLRHIVVGFMSLLLVIAIFSVYIYLRSGNFPDWNNQFKYQHIFYATGFNMLPMPLFHAWNILAIIYIVGMFISIRAVIEGENTYHSRMIFLLSILGIGLFSYYQGRSHDHVLTMVGYPATLLAAIFADRFILQWKTKGLGGPGKIYLLVIMTIFLFGLSALGYFENSGLTFAQAQRGVKSLFSSKYKAELKANVDFVRLHTVYGEKVFIIYEFNWDGIFYANTGTRNAANVPGSSELLLAEDVDKKILFLKGNTSKKVFVDFNHASPEITLILRKYYKTIGVSPNGLEYLQWQGVSSGW